MIFSKKKDGHTFPVVKHVSYSEEQKSLEMAAAYIVQFGHKKSPNKKLSIIRCSRFAAFATCLTLQIW